MKRLYAFDFDGTLTTADTLLVFIRYACGTWRFVWGFLVHSPLLVLMKLKLYPNYRGRTTRRCASSRGSSAVWKLKHSTRCADVSPTTTPV